MKIKENSNFARLYYDSDKALTIWIKETNESIQILPANNINETTVIFMDKVIKGNQILKLNKKGE